MIVAFLRASISFLCLQNFCYNYIVAERKEIYTLLFQTELVAAEQPERRVRGLVTGGATEQEEDYNRHEDAGYLKRRGSQQDSPKQSAESWEQTISGFNGATERCSSSFDFRRTMSATNPHIYFEGNSSRRKRSRLARSISEPLLQRIILGDNDDDASCLEPSSSL